MKKRLVPVLLCLLTAAARAQAPESWANVETVEVQAAPGPALWHLTRGTSEVWILGTVGAMPADMTWNRAYLSDLIDGARAVLMPPRASIGLLEGAWFLITNGGKLSLPRGQTLEGSLPDALRQHLIAVRTAIGQGESRYRTDTPIRAAWRLQGDFQDKTKLRGGEPGRTIADLARAKHVTVTPIGKYEVLDAAKDILNLSLGQQQVCLAEEMEDIDRLSAHAALAAHAWAIGDIKTVKDNYAESRLTDCITAAVHAIANINERNVADSTAAIDAALNQPGKTILVIGIGPLLRKNGVLQRLEAMHVAIEGPRD